MTLKNGLSFIDEENKKVIITSLHCGCVEFLREYSQGRYYKDITRQENFVHLCNNGSLRPLFRTREAAPTYSIYEPKTIIINL